jgi:hypothetical protein
MIRHGHDERASHLRPRGLFCVAIWVLALVVVGVSVSHVVGSGFGFVGLVRQTSERVVQAAERMITMRTQPPALHQVLFRASRSTSTSTSTTPSTSIGRVQRRPEVTPHVSAHSKQRASPQPYPPCELGLADVPSRPSFNNRSTEPNRIGGTSNMLKYGESTLRTFRVLELARVRMPKVICDRQQLSLSTVQRPSRQTVPPHFSALIMF